MLFYQVGWAHADMAPGMMLGQDENSWAFDGYNVSNLLLFFFFNIVSMYILSIQIYLQEENKKLIQHGLPNTVLSISIMGYGFDPY